MGIARDTRYFSHLAARSALTAAPMMPISSDMEITSKRLPCSGLIFTNSWSRRSSSAMSMNFKYRPLMKNFPGPYL